MWEKEPLGRKTVESRNCSGSGTLLYTAAVLAEMQVTEDYHVGFVPDHSPGTRHTHMTAETDGSWQYTDRQRY